MEAVRNKKKAVCLFMGDDLYHALEMACKVTRLSKTALLTLSLENDLKIKGFWPPKVRKIKTTVQV